jgi:glycosyltransferase involved in cell wall biosynthesis
MIPAYNAVATIRQTIDSVLAQGYFPADMQITVVDNASTDGTASIVTQLAEHVGVDRLKLHRNPENIGLIGNWNACLALARGEFVQLLHADDYVTPGFYRAVENAFGGRPDADLCLVRSLVVDQHGEPERLARRLGRTGEALTVYAIAYGNEFYAPGVVVRRRAYERLGGFSPMLGYVPDWEMWLRVLAAAPGVYVNDPLACYREAPGNATSRMSRTADDLRELIRFGPLVARRVSGFERRYWREFLRGHAAWAMKNWEQAGDADARRVNFAVWKRFASPGERLDLTLTKAKEYGVDAERRLRRRWKQLLGRT